jgi:hypothetical protein
LAKPIGEPTVEQRIDDGAGPGIDPPHEVREIALLQDYERPPSMRPIG